jgi:hypothetical protein
MVHHDRFPVVTGKTDSNTYGRSLLLYGPMRSGTHGITAVRSLHVTSLMMSADKSVKTGNFFSRRDKSSSQPIVL